MSCSQKSAVVSLITALIVAAAFFAIYAVSQADVLACEHDAGIEEVSADDDETAKPGYRKRQIRRGVI